MFIFLYHFLSLSYFFSGHFIGCKTFALLSGSGLSVDGTLFSEDFFIALWFRFINGWNSCFPSFADCSLFSFSLLGFSLEVDTSAKFIIFVVILFCNGVIIFCGIEELKSYYIFFKGSLWRLIPLPILSFFVVILFCNGVIIFRGIEEELKSCYIFFKHPIFHQIFLLCF
jgi:hypothetical protein